LFTSNMTKKKLFGATALLAAVGGFLAAGCRSTYDRRDPTGETFPAVRGDALDGREVEIPAAFAGKPVLLLIGYEQSTQFDLDRWMLGMQQAGVSVATYEVPTIPGLVPGLFSGYIDGGMRRGIPEEDWGGVVTVYGDGEKIARFTGNADGLPGRIVLLDGQGRVVFFHDRGFSPGTLEKLRAAVEAAR
jgi:hypothetical protein